MKRLFYAIILFLCGFNTACAEWDQTQLAVWANEAIIATYTYDYQNFIAQQQQIARYFSSAGWIAYSSALNNAHLPEMIKTNTYHVSAVATLPPTITERGKEQWQASMPILVVYKNLQHQQKQSLQVVITFSPAPQGQGVRGLAITSIRSTVIEPPCQCSPT